MNTAKVFWSGRSQAVRLPREFRVDSETVRIRRRGNAIILEPMVEGWDWLDRMVGPVDQDFADAVSEQLPLRDRPELDYFK